jgi:hypothetical protein
VPRDMFGDVVESSIKVGSQKWYTVPLSVAAHVLIFAAIIIIPLMATDVLPTPPSMMAFVAAAPPPPPPPPPPPAPAVSPAGAGGAAAQGAAGRVQPQRRTGRSPQGNQA